MRSDGGNFRRGALALLERAALGGEGIAWDAVAEASHAFGMLNTEGLAKLFADLRRVPPEMERRDDIPLVGMNRPDAWVPGPHPSPPRGDGGVLSGHVPRTLRRDVRRRGADAQRGRLLGYRGHRTQVADAGDGFLPLRRGGKIVENWLPDDTIGLMALMGVEVMARMRHLTGQPRLTL
ncbi:hypothetical protein JAN5088_00837 [Jannaschia rubra]|uniref:Uncharacterized protein n=1 Tax=Jannaschia rubra TaxID=282197 RepID=A0A0M6XPM1_9RHOB|nr:hypothetical protein JAN5088_00837 [Jannaschia rubra]SFG38149.1 hypothetical protein SAMN04488517_104157 [Jannaschia rubra]